MRRALTAAAGAAVGAALLYAALRNADLSALPGILGRADAWVALPVFLLYLLELYLRALRWKLLLAPSGRLGVGDAFKLEASALALSNVLPLRLGEAARAGLGTALTGIPAATVISSMLVERLMDAAVIVLLFLLAAGAGGAPGGIGGTGWLWALPALAAAGLALLAYERGPGARAGRPGRFPAVSSALEKLRLGAAAFRSPRTAAAVTALAALQWLTDAFNLWLIARAFGLGATVTPARSVGLLFSGAVAVSLPGLPGYFGNFEFAVSRALASWGADPGAAFACAAFAHLLSYIIFTLTGLACLYGMGQSLRLVWSRFRARERGTSAGVTGAEERGQER